MSFTINVEASAGCEWANLIREAFTMTRTTGANIKYSFNGLGISVFKNGNVLVNQGNMKFVDFTIDSIPEFPPYLKSSHPEQGG